MIANDKGTRGEIVKATVTHLLGIAFKENRLPLRCYDLSVLTAPYDFPVDPEDGIEGVEVRELRLMPILPNAGHLPKTEPRHRLNRPPARNGRAGAGWATAAPLRPAALHRAGIWDT